MVTAGRQAETNGPQETTTRKLALYSSTGVECGLLAFLFGACITERVVANTQISGKFCWPSPAETIRSKSKNLRLYDDSIIFISCLQSNDEHFTRPENQHCAVSRRVEEHNASELFIQGHGDNAMVLKCSWWYVCTARRSHTTSEIPISHMHSTCAPSGLLIAHTHAHKTWRSARQPNFVLLRCETRRRRSEHTEPAEYQQQRATFSHACDCVCSTHVYMCASVKGAHTKFQREL